MDKNQLENLVREEVENLFLKEGPFDFVRGAGRGNREKS